MAKRFRGKAAGGERIMFSVQDSYRQIKLVPPDDAEYIAWMRRMADRRPSRGGPRAAGEVLGGIVEQCVRHWLSGFVPLQPERILTWEQRLRNGRHGMMYREMDAVWTIDAESLCLFEMKLTFAENMERGVGIKQLNTNADILFASGQYQYILKRLVYVAEERVDVLDGLPVLEPADEWEELGVIWVPPASVVESAAVLGLTLPENWLEPESREGAAHDPARDEWRQWANTDGSPADSEADAELTPDAEREPSPDNPLAQALRRAMGQS